MTTAVSNASRLYTRCYCEENIWHLINSLHESKSADTYAVFISNSNRSVPIWCQSSAKPNQPVIWDYHVICLAKVSNDLLVFDFDTSLSNPTNFSEYITNALRPDIILPSKYQRLFRVISGIDYLKSFASDRSHMVNIVLFENLEERR